MAMDVSNLRDCTSFADTEARVAKSDAPTAAGAAECTCPDFCERDHDVD